jgi:hypothetical protein
VLGADRLTPTDLAKYKCNDCDANVVTIGEFYMCPDEVWEGELGLGWNDNLCIGCLETRLGRRVRVWKDITPVIPLYKWQQPYPTPERLLDRFGFDRTTPKKKRKR